MSRRFEPRSHALLDFPGDVVVDTFPLPSACVCHFRESPLGLSQRGLVGAAAADSRAKDAADSGAKEAAADGEEEGEDDPRCIDVRRSRS